jgi:hypothetical protein
MRSFRRRRCRKPWASWRLRIRQRQEELCERIRAGDFDGAEDERELVRYLVLETANRVRISAPAELKE